jgi:hypothetical protein
MQILLCIITDQISVYNMYLSTVIEKQLNFTPNTTYWDLLEMHEE